MQLKQLLYDFFCGAIIEDKEIASSGEDGQAAVPMWQKAVVALALLVGILLGIKTLLPE